MIFNEELAGGRAFDNREVHASTSRKLERLGYAGSYSFDIMR